MDALIETSRGYNPFETAHRKDPVVAHGKDFEYGTCSNTFTMKQCVETGLLYLDPRPSESKLSSIYPEDYLPYQFDRLPKLVRTARDWVQLSKVRTIRKLVGDSARILDIGCGSGTLLSLMKRRGSPGWELHGHDFKADVLEPLMRTGINVHSKPLDEMADSGSFDLIILNQVIEHVGNVRLFLADIRRLLKKGGVLFIETPNFDSVDRKLFSARYWGGYHFPRHWVLFNEKLLSRLLHEEGFGTRGVNYLSSPSFWVQSFHHLFQDRGVGFVARFFRTQNTFAMGFFTLVDRLLILLGIRTSNMRVVAQKQRG